MIDKLAISNIAWDREDKLLVYEMLRELGIGSIECAAPLLVKSENPYLEKDKAKEQKKLAATFGLKIVSLQSITFGFGDLEIFGKPENNLRFKTHMFKVIDFANLVGAKSIVFGCPKNRVIPADLTNSYEAVAIDFFKAIADYAYAKDCTINLEPNPIIYNTNFINDHKQAFDFVSKCKSKGLKINLDIGAFLENNEDLELIREMEGLIGHVHISEPYLNPVHSRKVFHSSIINLLEGIKYDGFISIEMNNTKSPDNLAIIKRVITYLKNIGIAS